MGFPSFLGLTVFLLCMGHFFIHASSCRTFAWFPCLIVNTEVNKKVQLALQITDFNSFQWISSSEIVRSHNGLLLFLFRFIYLKGRESEIFLPKWPQWPGLSKNSIWVRHTGGRDPRAWVILYVFPGTLAGRWIRSGASGTWTSTVIGHAGATCNLICCVTLETLIFTF